eukprot:GILI01019159.1.p1 GENE.GILI01019159.1~~GILI01019159.1.p1  ORF type:complete len:221 (-),score=40.58 GILI01019159.1:47-709(-)
MDKTSEDKIFQQSRLYRVMKTVNEMCADRRMPIPMEWCAKSLDDFKSRYCTVDGVVNRNSMSAHCTAEFHEKEDDNGGVCMIVFFNDADSMTAQHVKDYVSIVKQESVNRVLIVHREKLSATARAAVAGISSSDFRIECMEEERLVVNVTRHELVPKHEHLRPNELKDMLKGHSLKEHMLPRILSSDPLVVYFGLQRGDVLRITRKSETAGQYVTYRQVV